MEITGREITAFGLGVLTAAIHTLLGILIYALLTYIVWQNTKEKIKDMGYFHHIGYKQP